MSKTATEQVTMVDKGATTVIDLHLVNEQQDRCQVAALVMQSILHASRLNFGLDHTADIKAIERAADESWRIADVMLSRRPVWHIADVMMSETQPVKAPAINAVEIEGDKLSALMTRMTSIISSLSRGTIRTSPTEWLVAVDLSVRANSMKLAGDINTFLSLLRDQLARITP